jgi:transposase
MALSITMGRRRKKYSRDEARYNHIQEREIPLFLACLPGAVDAVLDRERLWQGVGRPPFKLYDILVCLLVKQYFHLSLRRCIGLLWAFKMGGTLDIDIPCFKTLDNYLNNGTMKKYLDRLVELTSALFSCVEKCMATDSTGISTTCFSTWFRIQVCKKSRRRDHIMVHITVGTKSCAVFALDVLTKRGKDSVILRSHVKKIGRRQKVEDWPADAAYLSRDNCDAVVAIGAKPWFNLKSNTTARKKGSQAWRDMVVTFKQNPEYSNEKYHMRSKVESANSAKKRKFGSFVRCRLPVAQRIEEAFSWVDYNFSLVSRASFEFGVSLPFN